MIKALRWLGLGLIALPWLTQAQDEGVPLYTKGGSFDQYIDKDGYVAPTISLGDVDFGKGLLLPVTLNYSSAIRSPSPEFGQGWECPLFEAKVFDVQKGLKRVQLLGGKEIVLTYNARTDGWKHFFSDHWTGKSVGDDFELTYDSGCKFFFKNGLISSVITPDGRTILWNRTGEKLVSLGESGKAPLLKIVYDNLGLAKQMVLDPDNLGASGNTYNFDSSLIYACIDKIQFPKGRTMSFERSRDKTLNPILRWADGLHAPITLSWSVKTGKILSDDRYTYQMEEANPDLTWPKMIRKSKATGKIESYYYDPVHGITEQQLADGTLRHTETIVTPGPNYKATRLIEETKNGKTREIQRKAFDDQGHLLLQAFMVSNGKEQTMQYTYDAVGHPTSYIFNGQKMWENIYDPATGLLKQRNLPSLGVTMAFEQLQDGQVREAITHAGGDAPKVQTLTPGAWTQQVSAMQRIQ